MTTGTALGVLVTDLREELKQATSSAVGANARLMHIRKLQRAQETLYDEHDWPFLRNYFYKNLAAGSYLYDYPTNLNSERIEKVWTLDGTERRRVPQGITPEDFSVKDSLLDERLDPVQKWDHRSGNQYEVWPVPASNVTKGMIFQGITALVAFTQDVDLCTLDGSLIVLTAAAAIRAGKADEVELRQAAGKRLATLKNRFSRKRMVVMGSGYETPRGGISEVNAKWA